MTGLELHNAAPSVLPVLAAACLIPPLLGFIRNEWTVSLGYAGAVVAGAGVVASSMAPVGLAQLHAYLLIAWGVRLGGFLLWRQLNVEYVKAMQQRIEDRAPSQRFKRTPFVLGCGLLYLGLVSPLVLSSRYLAGASEPILNACKVSLAMLIAGGVVEAVGDFQKSHEKAKNENLGSGFVSQGLFSIIRHPQHFGEMFVWLGSFLTGVLPALASGHLSLAWPWILGSALSLAGIQFVLVAAQTNLEKKQNEKYGTDPNFLDYKKRTWGGITFRPKP